MLKWFRRDARPAAAINGLTLTQPWLRPDAADVTQAGGYLILTNAGGVDRLVAASSPLAKTIESHAIKVLGADIGMQPLPQGLAIPAGSTIALKPRGYHLLLLGLRTPPAVGSRVPVTLTFEMAGRIDIELQVEPPGLVGSDILNEEAHRR